MLVVLVAVALLARSHVGGVLAQVLDFSNVRSWLVVSPLPFVGLLIPSTNRASRFAVFGRVVIKRSFSWVEDQILAHTNQNLREVNVTAPNNIWAMKAWSPSHRGES